jgi:Fe-S-cluster-containing dehydrogenase component
MTRHQELLSDGSFPDRRSILQMMAAALAAAGLDACGRAPEKAVPYVAAPSGAAPGQLETYATALTRDGLAIGVISRNRMARPLKIEGNPEHPASLGGTDPILEASLLSLYDPDRSKTVLLDGRIATLDGLLGALVARLARLPQAHGKGLAILSETVTSPTLARQRALLAARYSDAKWHRWDGGFHDAGREARRRAFGRLLDPVPHLEKAEIILAVDSDLFDGARGHLAHARAFGEKRRELASGGRGNRLYAIESTPTLTGANADHRFAVPAARIAPLMAALAARLGIAAAAPGGEAPPWLPALAQDLSANKGRAFVHAGPYQPASVQLIATAINEALGAPGRTLDYIESVELDGEDALASLSSLVADMRDGHVEALLILGGNPAFSAPPDLGFAEAVGRVPFTLHLATHANETTAVCRWHLPQAHELESWGDARAFDGTATIVQPQIDPLYGGWTAPQLLAVLTGETRPDAYDLVRATWSEEARRRGIADYQGFWANSLRRGVVAGTAAPAKPATLARGVLDQAVAQAAKDQRKGMRVLFRPDPFLCGGAEANNGYLQELPRPLTKLTWGNAAFVAPGVAKKLGLESGRIVELRTASGTLRAPVWIMSGQAEDCLTLPVGFGRRVCGRVGKGVGFDAFALRAKGGLCEMPLEGLAKTSQRARLATTQRHRRMQGEAHDIVRHGTLAQFRRDPKRFAAKPPKETLYPPYAYSGYAWAMAIDLSSCIGCSACVAACAVENNTPVVGREEVEVGRDMHWLRVDLYFEEQATLFQPVPCMHCENAPCEVVCPVDATVHDHDGLNVMVYNRCIGTRFCSNNCPYKVRRFNYLDFAKRDPRLDFAWNPELSVRGRGVMEKCTYCIQRIREAEIKADRENRKVRDGEIRTACQAACPTQAIAFGNLNDPDSTVMKRKALPLDYGLFEELNTRPRTTYQARLANPNPAIAAS